MSMKEFDYYELYHKFISQGFTESSLSKITGLSKSLIQKFAKKEELDYFEQKEIKKILQVLDMFYIEEVAEPSYLSSLMETICEEFSISQRAIANYLGLDLHEYKKFIKNPDQYEYSFVLC